MKQTTYTARSLSAALCRSKFDCTAETVLSVARELKIGSPGRFKNSPYRFTPGEADKVTAAIVRTKTAEMQNQIARVQDKTRNLRASTLNILRDFGRLSELALIHGHACAPGLAKLSPIMRGLEKLEIPNASMNKADFIKAETSWARIDKAAHAIFESEVEPFLDPEPQAAPEPTGPRPAAGAHTRYNFICHMQRKGSWEKESHRVCVEAESLKAAGAELEAKVAVVWPAWTLQSYEFDGRS